MWAPSSGVHFKAKQNVVGCTLNRHAIIITVMPLSPQQARVTGMLVVYHPELGRATLPHRTA